jgi:hypothetical protein
MNPGDRHPLDEYSRNRKALYGRVPAGNRQYPASVATTWSMSFQVVSTNNPQATLLLQLLSLLNPDEILVDFLHSGLEALRL